MKDFIISFFKNLFNSQISITAMIDSSSSLHSTVRINRFVKIRKSKIGKYTYIGAGSWLTNVEIGNFCSIADKVNLGLASHTLSFLSTSPLFTEKNNATGYQWTEKTFHKSSTKLIIGNDVWIGSRVLIKGGITIGDGAVIGAGAVVTNNVPPYAIVGGVPAKIIRYRFEREVIEQLEEKKWWDWNDELIKQNISLFQQQISLESLKNFGNCKK